MSYGLLKYVLNRNHAAEERRSDPGFHISDAEKGETVEEIQTDIRRRIIKHGNQFSYNIDFLQLTPAQREAMSIVKAKVVDSLSDSSEQIDMGLMGKARELARSILPQGMDQRSSSYISYIVAHDTVGYGPISILLEDKERIEEIEINSPTAQICIFHPSYGRCVTNLRFAGEYYFRNAVNKFIEDTDKELNDTTPIIDAQVGDARVHAQTKPYAASSAVATIRLGGRKDIDVCKLCSGGTASSEMLAYLWLAMESGLNIVIAGAPASGKTTFLTSILAFAKRYRRIIVIEEDVNEFKFYHNAINMVPLYGTNSKSSVSTREQARNALRMRPEIMVIGEIRGDEAKELFGAANTGIQFLTTMHSNETGQAIIKRLLTKPMEVDDRLISQLDMSVYMREDGLSRKVSNISEYRWLSRAEILEPEQNINDSDSVGISSIVENCTLNRQALRGSKAVLSFAKSHGISDKQAMKELDRRRAFLEGLCSEGLQPLQAIEGIYSYE